MKTHLMFRDADFDVTQEPAASAQALVADLGLEQVFDAMASGDAWLRDVCAKAMLNGSSDRATLLYRQAVLQDCIEHAEIVRAMYDLATETIEAERKSFWFGTLARRPSSVLYRADQLLHMLVEKLRRLKGIARKSASSFASEGFTAFFRMLEEELDEAYMLCVDEHLRQLKFEQGVLVSAHLGDGNKGAGYVLHRHTGAKSNWLRRFLSSSPAGVYTFQLSPRDESGMRALSELRDRTINSVADAAAQAADHILSFFSSLRAELAFYVGALNLRTRLEELGAGMCFPEPAAAEERRHAARGLYDPSLALNSGRAPVSNALQGDGTALFVITGANQGGKSTFLRSIGIAQLMMQCGMFVAASSFSANVAESIFTHYRREEDTAMKSGKLDEELRRMSGLVDVLVPNSLVLFNESFAATNEREGSEIARQVVTALIESGVKAFFVTHLYDFAQSMLDSHVANVRFLRAERLADGTRNYKIVEGEALETSYGEDLYRHLFPPRH